MEPTNINIARAYFTANAKAEDVQKFYKEFSESYDQNVQPDNNYPCVPNLVKVFTKVVGEEDKDIKIIDLGAGTGIVAAELKKFGFTNIDALDASEDMLEKAKEKGLYKNYICEYVTSEKQVGIPTGTYDALISCGTITSGYVKSDAIDEVLRLVKHSGHIVFTIRKDAYDGNQFGYRSKFEELEISGKWKEMHREISDYLLDGLDFQRTCFIFCFKLLKHE